MYKATVYVTLKEGVLDPQGSAVEQSLHSLNFKQVNDVRIGKYMQMTIEANSEEDANRQLTEMCERLLANPVIENYSFQLSAMNDTVQNSGESS